MSRERDATPECDVDDAHSEPDVDDATVACDDEGDAVDDEADAGDDEGDAVDDEADAGDDAQSVIELRAGDRDDPDSETVFELLSDETRLSIVRALAELSSEQWVSDAVSYSDLRESVGVEDGGRFNYHLGKLRGVVVTRDGDEYWLTGRGRRIARFLRSGRARRGPAVAEESVDTCSQCDRALQLRFDDGALWTECPEHGHCWDMILPPAAGEHHDAATLERYAWVRSQWYVELARRGACQECWGSVETRVVGAAAGLEGVDAPTVAVECERCSLTYWLGLPAFVLTHPAVVAFWWDQGVDVRSTPPTENPAVASEAVDVARSPTGARVEYSAADATLVVELAEDGTVVDTERVESGQRGECS